MFNERWTNDLKTLAKAALNDCLVKCEKGLCPDSVFVIAPSTMGKTQQETLSKNAADILKKNQATPTA